MRLLKNPNELIGKLYDEEHYHCYTFLEEVVDVPQLKAISVALASEDVAKHISKFKEIEEPFPYCIALLGESHIGLYFENGCYHNDTGGVRYEPLRSLKLKYKGVKFYDVR